MNSPLESPKRPSTTMAAKLPPPLETTAKAKTVTFSSTARIQEKRKVKYVSSAPDDFGTQSPHWTIPSSRTDPPPPPDYPGPGQYNIKSSIRVNKKNFIGQTIGVRGETKYSTDTSNINIPNIRAFPEIRRRSISELSGRHFYDLDPTPAPTYNSPGLELKKKTIGARFKEKKPDKIPSPAEYDVKRVDLPSPIYVALPRKEDVYKSRSLSYDSGLGESINDTPGPGAYNVTPELRKPKKWTERLRVHPERYTRPHFEYDRPWKK